MQPLTPERDDELFNSFQHFAYHLEMRDWYAVDEEKERLAQWRAGKLERPPEPGSTDGFR